MKNQMVACDGIYLLMLLGVETFISPSSRAQSLTPLGCFLPPLTVTLCHGSNLANRSHIVPLINDSAATSGVWADLERRERLNKRQTEGWRRGSFFLSFFFLKWHKKLARREEVKKSLQIDSTTTPLKCRFFPPSFLVK